LKVSHLILVAGCLIIYSVFTGILVFYYLSSWFICLLILIFLGGVIVLIAYIVTLAGNDKIDKININLVYWGFFSSLSYFLFIFRISNYNIGVKIVNNLELFRFIYSSNNSSITIFLIIYLLVTIICVVKLVKLERGPLVKRL